MDKTKKTSKVDTAEIDAELKEVIAEEEKEDYEHVQGKDLKEENLDEGIQLKEEEVDSVITPNAPLENN